MGLAVLRDITIAESRSFFGNTWYSKPHIMASTSPLFFFVLTFQVEQFLSGVMGQLENKNKQTNKVKEK